MNQHPRVTPPYHFYFFCFLQKARSMVGAGALSVMNNAVKFSILQMSTIFPDVPDIPGMM